MKENIKIILKNAVKHLYNVEANPQILQPKEETFGDFSSNISFILSKNLKKSPQDIAVEISSYLSKLSQIRQANALKGFVNIVMSDSFYEDLLFEFLVEPLFYLKNQKQDILNALNITPEDKINLEYVSANPTGPLHLGHGRGAVIGDVLYRLFRFFDINVDREYYINDAGNQVNLLALSILHFINPSHHFPEDGYKGDYVKDLAEKIRDKVGENLESIKTLALDMIMQDIKQTLKLINIEFDIFFSERQLYNGSIQEVLKLLEEKGLCEEKDGALWFKSDDEEKDRVLKKKDGNYTYFASDIAYHLDKYKRGYKKAINLWGADHHGYISRLKSALKSLGIPENWLDIELFQIVKLFENNQELKMSKRTGKMLKLQDIIEELGADNLRFVFLTKKADTPLNIDIDLVKSQNSENPVFYVQYAYARTKGIQRQLTDIDFYFYKESYSYEMEEIELIKNILNIKDILKESIIKKDPSIVVKTSIDIAKAFHKFYNKYKIITEDLQTTKKRITLTYATQKSFDIIFDILNIKAPEIM